MARYLVFVFLLVSAANAFAGGQTVIPNYAAARPFSFDGNGVLAEEQI